MQSPSTKTFPIVSMGKFTTLYFATMGWYALYWFYQCWAAYRMESDKKVSPIFRAFFSVFFVHELFGYIQKKEPEESPYPWDPSQTAWTFIGVGAVGVSLTLLAEYFRLGAFVRLFIFIVLLFAQYYILYRVQLVINRVAKDPYGQANSKMSLENNLWIAFGLYLWFSSFYNCYLEATGQITIPPMFETQIQNTDIPKP